VRFTSDELTARFHSARIVASASSSRATGQAASNQASVKRVPRSSDGPARFFSTLMTTQRERGGWRVNCSLSSGCHNPCSVLIASAARSPMTTQGAMVFPVVMRGMIEASATRRCSTP
jgi:invasion protein IalB